MKPCLLCARGSNTPDTERLKACIIGPAMQLPMLLVMFCAAVGASACLREAYLLDILLLAILFWLAYALVQFMSKSRCLPRSCKSVEVQCDLPCDHFKVQMSMPTAVYFAPQSGTRWHVDPSCCHLRQALKVQSATPCKDCANVHAR